MQPSLTWIFVNALLINNFTLVYFIGLCPFFGCSNKLDTGIRLGVATIFVMEVTVVCAWALNTFVLEHAPYLRLLAFIVAIASAVQFVEMVIKKFSKALFDALGIYLPLITTNCAVLALALFYTTKGYSLVAGLVYGVGVGGGGTLALVLMAGIREELELARVPAVVKGTAMNLFVAALLSFGFMGFAGLFAR